MRQFRDLFTLDIFTAANGGVEPPPAVFFLVDLPGACVSGILLATFVLVKDNGKAVLGMHALMIVFLLVLLGANLAFSANCLNYFAWQSLVGLGLFGSYTTMTTPVYDRLVGLSAQQGGTCTFLILASDCSGYIGTISLLIWKTFAAGDQSAKTALDQFIFSTYVLSAFVL